MNIGEEEFPISGNDLSPREYKILTDLVGEKYLNLYNIKVDDHYYHTKRLDCCNRFDDFSELRDYLSFNYYNLNRKAKEFIELLKTSKLDPSFDYNWSIWLANSRGDIEIVKHLLNDERVRSKLTEEEINKYTKYTNEIS
jgi:hypothetical protein